MKKLFALLLVLGLILSMAACASKAPETTEPPAAPETTEPPAAQEATEAPAAPQAPAEGELLEGLQVTVFKVIDRKTVVVRFNQDRWGYTDTPNYQVVDETGKAYELESCNSAFWDMGGDTPNVFTMIFKDSLPVGNYTITVSNITDAITEPFHTYAPCQTVLMITDDVTESAQAQAVDQEIGQIALDVQKIVDSNNIIVHFDIECIGCTDAPNYIVKNEKGEQIQVVSAQSAFVEMGGTMPNVFKLTFAQPLTAGTYTVTATNMASTTATTSIYPDAVAEFTV